MVNTIRGIPAHCNCGARVSRNTSRTKNNPGRLFHSCPFGNEQNRSHVFKWTDESMVEEIEDLKPKILDLESAIAENGKRLRNSTSLIQSITLESRTSSTLVHRLEARLSAFDQDIQGLKMELKGFRNMVVCLIVLFLCYKVFL
ncbi:unnamed protein product [Eruca vesicaria subsp. sativa]|uniref:GRF-type domain-containing protein n=1 Tax=Eruca vesicaria subsp. sativa TaxID=29727 RepID=A0ABC8M308_ERUVS|nr:unnamed protein product [Eruca vesicaria subsp. sativa]